MAVQENCHLSKTRPPDMYFPNLGTQGGSLTKIDQYLTSSAATFLYQTLTKELDDYYEK